MAPPAGGVRRASSVFLLLLNTIHFYCYFNKFLMGQTLDYNNNNNNNMGQIRMKKRLVNTDERCLLQSLSLMQLLDYNINPKVSS